VRPLTGGAPISVGGAPIAVAGKPVHEGGAPSAVIDEGSAPAAMQPRNTIAPPPPAFPRQSVRTRSHVEYVGTPSSSTSATPPAHAPVARRVGAQDGISSTTVRETASTVPPAITPRAVTHSPSAAGYAPGAVARPTHGTAYPVDPAHSAPRAFAPGTGAPVGYQPGGYILTPAAPSQVGVLSPPVTHGEYAQATPGWQGEQIAAAGFGVPVPPEYSQQQPLLEEPQPKRKRHIGRIVVLSLIGLLVLSLAWPLGLMHWANGQILHVDALSGAPNTPGTTFLLVRTDERSEEGWQDATEGQRSDTIMLLNRPSSGTPSLISIPRDTYVQIPGYAPNKINAAFSLGGAPLLVQTVEQLTGLTIDHYVEIGMGGLIGLVDAVGGVELCLDMDVRDWRSALYWTAGCHVADGRTALAFARMRYSDPRGDIGRAQRQQQVINAITHAVATPTLLVQPGQQRELIRAGLSSVRTDEDTNIWGFASLALAFRAANGDGGFTGSPPISSMNYRPGNIGAAVQLDPELIGQFWADVRNGDLTPKHGSHVGVD